MKRGGGPGKATAQTTIQQAVSLLQAGRSREARDLLVQAAKRWPKDGSVHYFLGRLDGDLGRLEDGVAGLRRAVRCDPQKIEFHLALARSLIETGAAEEALQAIDRAVALQPKQAGVHCARADCLERLNRIDEGIAAAERALELAPERAEAGILCGRLLGRRGDWAGARARLEAALAAREIQPYDRIRGQYELGVVLDKLGEHDAAYAAFDESGRRQLAGPAARIERGFAPRRVDLYRQRTTPELLRRFSPADFADERPAPTFLVGFPRSGTTLTEQILAAHPGVSTTDEKPVLGQTLRRLAGMLGARDLTDVVPLLEQVDRDQVRELRRAYWEQLERACGPLSGLVVDKLPLNLVHVPAVHVLFPDAKLLVALRDPRDVCLSCFQQWFGLNESMVQFLSLRDTARFYGKVMELWLHVRGMAALPFLEVRYEDTVEDLEREGRRMLELLGLPWDPSLLAFHERASERHITTPSYAAVTSGVHKGAIGRWKHYRGPLREALPVLRPFVEAFGYEAG